jgi:hypothetical protein
MATLRSASLITAVCLFLIPGFAFAGAVMDIVPAGSAAYSDMRQLAKDGLVRGDFSGAQPRTRLEFALAINAMPPAPLSQDDMASADRLKAEFDQELATIKQRVESASAEASLRDDEMAELEDQVDDLNKQIRAKTFTGGKVPEITSILGAVFQDITGYGLPDRHGDAIVYNFTLAMAGKISDGSTVIFNFNPGLSPGLMGSYEDAGDAIQQGPSGSRNSIFDAFKVGWVSSDQSADLTLGNQFWHNSELTISGKLSDRPVLFERSPYSGNQSTKSAFENQFLSGIPKRAPEESEHPLMGGLGDLALPYDLKWMVMTGYNEGYYDSPYIGLHEYASSLKLDKAQTTGTEITGLLYYRGNDRSELDMLGTPGYTFNSGLQSNTLYGLNASQKFGHWTVEAEGNMANYKKYDGDSTSDNSVTPYAVLNSPVMVSSTAWSQNPTFDLSGLAMRGKLEYENAGFKLGADGYSISPNYLVNAGGTALLTDNLEGLRPGTTMGSRSNTQADGLNDLSYRPDPRPGHTGQVLHDTVVSDPTLPMIDTNTYGLSTQFSVLHTFFSFRLQNSAQQDPTSAVIVSSHFLNGQNLDGGGWFSFFSNNYSRWDPADYYITGYPLTATATENFSQQLDSYNRQTYKGIVQSQNSATDGSSIIYDHAYRQLESFQWRTQQEQILTSDRTTGKALDPSCKYISYANMDMRSRLNEMLGMSQGLYLQLFQDITTVNDQALMVPSSDPDNLFVQMVTSSTLVFNMTPSINLLLNAGYENWRSDRVYGPYTLHYDERQAGTGFDWDIYPGKLSIYGRIKVFYHYDAFCEANNFIGRQMWWELKSYF